MEQARQEREISQAKEKDQPYVVSEPSEYCVQTKYAIIMGVLLADRSKQE